MKNMAIEADLIVQHDHVISLVCWKIIQINKSKIVNILISDVRHDPLDEARLQFRGERS